MVTSMLCDRPRFISFAGMHILSAGQRALAILLVCQTAVMAEETWDVVVYGGTSAAVTTAVQCKAMGKSAVIVCPDRHLGGLTSGGLGWTDSGNKDAIGGLSRDFYHRVWKYYQQPESWKWEDQAKFGNRNQSPPGTTGRGGSAMWVFEPHAAEGIFERMIAEAKIPVYRSEWLDRRPDAGANVVDGRIQSITMLSGRTFRGRMFVDATYEGDLLASAGVDYHVGREANSVYDEEWNGIQVGVLHHSHWFKKPVDPYRVPGDPSSGLLPGISDEPPGIRGAGDLRVQAYCFRMCLTNVDDNRHTFSPPYTLVTTRRSTSCCCASSMVAGDRCSTSLIPCPITRRTQIITVRSVLITLA